MKPKRFRGLVRLLVVAFLAYAGFCVAIALWQRHMIYVPPHYSKAEVDGRAQKARLERWLNASGEAIGMKRLSPRQPPAGKLLVVYGNGSWTVGCAHYADGIQSRGDFDVYILEYPGYADRAGVPTQTSLFQAADEGLQLLGTNQPLYVLGESLGTGVAAHLAATFPDRISGIVLLSPFNRLAGVAQRRMPLLPVWLLLADRFPSEDYLRQYQGPVGVVVDGNDTIVPREFGLLLYDGYAGPKRLWNFPTGYHISIEEPPTQFWGEVLDFWHGRNNLSEKR